MSSGRISIQRARAAVSARDGVRCTCAFAARVEFDDLGLTPNGQSLQPATGADCVLCGNTGRTTLSRLRTWTAWRVCAAVGGLAGVACIVLAVLATTASVPWLFAGVAGALALSEFAAAGLLRRSLTRETRSIER